MTIMLEFFFVFKQAASRLACGENIMYVKH